MVFNNIRVRSSDKKPEERRCCSRFHRAPLFHIARAFLPESRNLFIHRDNRAGNNKVSSSLSGGLLPSSHSVRRRPPICIPHNPFSIAPGVHTCSRAPSPLAFSSSYKSNARAARPARPRGGEAAAKRLGGLKKTKKKRIIRRGKNLGNESALRDNANILSERERGRDAPRRGTYRALLQDIPPEPKPPCLTPPS